jgi:hypothetical protein
VDQCDPGGGGISAGGGGVAGGGLSGGAPLGECGLPGLQALGAQPTDGSIQGGAQPPQVAAWSKALIGSTRRSSIRVQSANFSLCRN